MTPGRVSTTQIMFKATMTKNYSHDRWSKRYNAFLCLYIDQVMAGHCPVYSWRGDAGTNRTDGFGHVRVVAWIRPDGFLLLLPFSLLIPLASYPSFACYTLSFARFSFFSLEREGDRGRDHKKKLGGLVFEV